MAGRFHLSQLLGASAALAIVIVSLSPTVFGSGSPTASAQEAATLTPTVSAFSTASPTPRKPTLSPAASASPAATSSPVRASVRAQVLPLDTASPPETWTPLNPGPSLPAARFG